MEVIDNSLLKFGALTTAVIFGLIQTILVLYFFSKNKRYKSHVWMIILMIVLLIMQLESFLLQSGVMYYFPIALTISTPFTFLLGPIFYEYTKSQIDKSTFKITTLLHLIPFVFYFIYSFYFFLQPYEYKRELYLTSFRYELFKESSNPIFSIDPLNIRGWVVVEIISLHLLLYGLISLYKAYKVRLDSSNDLNARVNWLKYINIILIFSALVLFLSQGGIVNNQVFFKPIFPKFSPDLISVAFIYFITFYIINKPNLFKSEERKYYKSSLTSFYKKEKSNQIISLLENNKLYLDSNFSLKMLAEKSKISTHNISQILNEELNTNFMDLTNHYRILEAKRILDDTTNDIKIEQLSGELGYKSKSTFFRVFKKATNMTPAQYRNKK